jgi:molecular chaperone GrpE
VADRKHAEKTPPSPDSEVATETRRDTLLDLDAAALADQLAAAQAEKEELRHTLVRRQADFENYRKRIERERLEEAQRSVARLIEALLPVLDAFERALAAHDDPAYEDYRKGFELIYRQLWDAFERQGLNRIEAEGKTFDPHLHHAVERVESEDHEDGAVVEVLQPGYRLRDKVLRPATVRVAVHPAEPASEQVN